MSSNPHGIRFSPFTTGAAQPQAQKNGQTQLPIMLKVPPKPKQYQPPHQVANLSGSDTDVSTSNENLSKEERFVIKHTARVEPQGQENLTAGKVTPVNDASQLRYASDSQQLRFSTNTSSDSTRYATPTGNRSASETRGSNVNPNQVVYVPPTDSNRSSMIASTNSNRNSLKESNSNRSSMDVSQSSYNTLIIHDDTNYCEYTSPPPYNSMKKDRPRSYGEQQMQDITVIPEEYLNQSHVLKHLAKEVKLPHRNDSDSNTRDSGVSENASDSHPPRYHDVNAENNKLKSKSQPDLTRLGEIDYEDVEVLIKENNALKQQLNVAHIKMSKTQKLQQEIANIHRDYEALVQSNERRELLEQAARNRFQNELRHAQQVNQGLREQIEALQNQIISMSNTHQMNRPQQDALISQLVAQNKELADANKRQYIEIQAQHATLEEQRIHITVLDNALKRLEEENRQKQVYVERCAQLQHALQSLQNASERRTERMLMLDTYDNDIENGNAAGEAVNLKWQLREKDNQIMRLEAECAKLEQRNIEDANVRNVAKMAMEKNSQETERIIAEANKEKLRYLDEAHTTNRKVSELQTKLKLVENRLAEKDSIIRALQGQKIYGSTGSYGSYNFSTDSFALNPLGFNSQASFDVSNNSFDVTNPTTSLLDPNAYGPNSSSSYSQSASISTAYTSNYGQSNPTIYDSFDVQRKSIDDQLKQLDEALLSKRGLCCFPSLSSKKSSQPLLCEESIQLSSNNSDAFLENLKQIEHRGSRSRCIVDAESAKPEEMVLLEKQGRCSQKLRNTALGNLAQVTQNVGQNMTDISNIGGKKSPSPTSKVPKIMSSLTQAGILPPRKDRGSSLPPSALPRPPRSLKPPRKIEYGRLGPSPDPELKKRSQTPPTPTNAPNDFQKGFELKTSSLKRNDDFNKREFSPAKNYMEMKETIKFGKAQDYNMLKRHNYGAIYSAKQDAKFGFKQSDFSKPDYTSTRNYQRLDEPRKNSLLGNPRKISPMPQPTAATMNMTAGNTDKMNPKNSRDSLNSANSSGSTQSNTSTTPTPIRQSPCHAKSESNSSSSITFHNVRSQYSPGTAMLMSAKQQTPTSFMTNTKNKFQNQMQNKSSSLPSSSILHAKASASLPPTKPMDMKNQRGHSLARGENKYRIQF